MTFHVTAPLQFDTLPTAKRSICAPFDGQIEHVFVHPGQTEAIRKGDRLFSMKTDDLQKQALQSYSEALSHKAKEDMYRSDPTKQAEAMVERDQYLASKASYDYYQHQVDQGIVYAPFDGQVMTAKSDLSDREDTDIKQGEPLMEFGDPAQLRADLQVADRDVQFVSVDQFGTLATTSEPTNKVRFQVARIVPQGDAKEGANVFTVYGIFPDAAHLPPGWRPGMTGRPASTSGRSRSCGSGRTGWWTSCG